MKYFTLTLIKLCMFALNYIHKGDVLAKLRAFFIAPFIFGTVPPCNSVIVLLPLWCSSTGKAVPYFSACHINSLKMNYTREPITRCDSTTASRAVNFLLDCTSTKDLRQGLHKAREVFLKHIKNPEDRDQVNFACMSVNRALRIIEKGGKSC
jgi:hypothetical protein